ncbi:MAG TPA: sialidase family protein [Cyclobacteriaceae bacterium]|nr:sialidase family protein [Cyclobacteriaceae bacterium]
MYLRFFVLLGLLTQFSCKDDSPAIPQSVECVTSSGAFPQFIALPPVGDNGSYDPTLAGDPMTGRVWMVFSRINGAGGEGQVSSHLAFSDDHGSTWCYANEINSSKKVELSQLPTEFTSAVSAHWSHEVPSLAFDPNAAVNQRWRMTWHRYLHVNDGIPGNDDRRFAFGWVAMKTASDPMLLAAAPEIKLFSGRGYYKDAETEQYNNSIGGVPQVRLHELHPDLSGAVLFTEPGMQVFQNELYVTLLMGEVTVGNSIVMLKYNNSNSWSYVSTLLTPADAQTMNPLWTGFSATDLFIQNNQAYLLVSPVEELYEGLLLFRLDLSNGKLIDSNGNGPDIKWSLPTTSGSSIFQTGAGTYDSLSYNSGILYGDALITAPQFRVYASGFIPE